jgi:hypothetical protein
LVYGTGNDWDRSAARTPVAGQALVHQWLDSASGDTMWAQGTSSANPNSGATVALADSAPTNDRYNIVAVEITSGNGAATLQSIAKAEAISPPSFGHVVHYAFPDEPSTSTAPLDKRTLGLIG